jgi:hypothetical protein
MTAEAILARLIALCPDFAAAWESPHNYFRGDDGEFTRCGVFAQFSHYFRGCYEQLTSAQVEEVGRFATECVASAETELADAAAACFLENVAAERFSADFQRHLSGGALRFYRLWNDSAESDA